MRYFKLVIPALLLMSCEKVIDVNLNDSAPQLVAEAAIDYEGNTHLIYLTKTANYFGSSGVTAVPGAVVTMTGPGGDQHDFTYIGNSMYQNTDSLSGGLGLYSLQIDYDGTTSVAMSTLPTSVGIDSLTIKTLGFGSNTFNYVQLHISDPIAEENYYQIISYRNDTLIDAFRGISDENFTETNPVINLRGLQLQPGNHVKVILRNIDKAMYDYLDEVRALSSGGFSSPSPSNPTPYFESGPIKLGYFNVFHESVVEYTMP